MPRRVSSTEGTERPALALVVATRECEIGFANTDTRRRLRAFFGRSARPGMLPRKVCHWLSEAAEGTGKQPLIANHDDARMIVRRVAIDVPDVIALSLQLVPKAARVSPGKHGPLSARENDVLQWIAAGKSTIEIAEILGLAPTTVSKHLEHIFKKLGVDNRTAAAASLYTTSFSDHQPEES